MSILDICVTTQNILSLACETTIAPADMDDTTSALATGDSKPKVGINGNIKDAVVINATVDEPWAVFKAAAIIKGSQIPMLACDDKDLLSTSASCEFRRIIPNEPPAPVIIIIIAASVRDCPTQPVVDNISLLSFLGSRKAIRTPIINAITGSPIKSKRVLKLPSPNGWLGKSAKDLNTMKIIGNMIGRNALIAEGASLIRAFISASESSGLGSI